METASPAQEIRELIKSGIDLLVTSRKLLAGCVLAGLLLGLVHALRSPQVWTSRMLVAAVQQPTDEKLKGLGSLLGKGTSLGGEEMDLFATILSSERIGRQILTARISSPDSAGRRHPVSHFLGLDTNDRKKVEGWLAGLPQRITISPLGSKTSTVLQISMTAGRGWLAREMLKIAYDSASREVLRIRGTRLQTQLPHLEGASRVAASELDQIAKQITHFQIQNRSLASPDMIGKQDSLLRERQVLERKYLAIRQEVEETIITLAKMSPPCMIVDPANLPASKTAPKRSLIVLFGLVLGFSVGCGWIFGREALR